MALARYGRRGLGCTTLNTELGWTTLWEDYGKRLPMYRHQGVGRGGPSLARSRHEAASGAASQQASLSSPWFRCARPLDPAGSSGPCVRSSVSCLGRCFTVAALVERGPRGYFEGSSQASRRAVVGGPRLASGTSVAKGRPSRGGPPLVAIKPPLVGGSRRLVYVWHTPMACAGSQRPQRRSQQTREARHLGTQLTAQRSPATVR